MLAAAQFLPMSLRKPIPSVADLLCSKQGMEHELTTLDWPREAAVGVPILHVFRKERDVMSKKLIGFGLMVLLVCFAGVSTARADTLNKQTVVTFSQPVEIPGRVLPAGTYTFKLLDPMSDRDIVEVANANDTKEIALVMAISDYRLAPTDKTVLKFSEVRPGAPEAIKAWFYPGSYFGEEFVYPKHRALQLASASHTVVPAMPTEEGNREKLKVAPVTAVTPEQTEAPVASLIQTTPPAKPAPAPAPAPAAAPAATLPKTASLLPTTLLGGFALVGAALGLMVYGRRSSRSLR